MELSTNLKLTKSGNKGFQNVFEMFKITIFNVKKVISKLFLYTKCVTMIEIFSFRRISCLKLGNFNSYDVGFLQDWITV